MSDSEANDLIESQAARIRALRAALVRAVRLIQELEDTISGQPRSDAEVSAELHRETP